MVAYFRTMVRALTVAAVLALAAPVADAGTRATEPAKAETKSSTADREHSPFDGLLIIAGIVAVVVFAAWVASRVGDGKPHVMG